MITKALLLCTILIVCIIAAGCDTGITQEDYDSLSSELAEVEDELNQAKAIISELQSTLAEIQGELDDFKANPPVLEVDYVDIGGIAKLTNLRMSKETSDAGTHIIECQLELTGELPDRTNVVDVELYIDDKFITFERWIDISSSGFVTTKPEIALDTGLQEFAERIKLKIVPSFKVF